VTASLTLPSVNRLAAETSPYLRQHADNPVDWFPWGDDAFAAARERDRPVLLSVGYSACHWCHVMAHESFEDDVTAEEMNRLFVNVKVDREERPDVDALYMQAVQALTGHGGWPMTVFLTPDGRPFFGGTYFPPDDRPGMPSFRRLLAAIDEAWRERRDDLDGQAEQLTDALAAAATPDPAQDLPGAEVLSAARAGLGNVYEPIHGGFGGAPKFPPSMVLRFLLRDHARTGDPTSLDMARTTLDAMAAGGIRDHVGGGFHRYSVDARWLVPHFEKMLYDQALLLRAYTQGYVATRESRWATVVEEIVDYLMRDLRDDAGGFYSAEDADSEGVEGLFYIWDDAELRSLLGADADDVVSYFGVTAGGNFEGANILNVVDRTAPRSEAVTRALPLLREARARRTRPGLDDKVLLAWNALLARALAEAAAVFERADWMVTARDLVRFLGTELRGEDGRLLRSWQAGVPRHNAVAEDYAALLGAQLTLAELDDIAWLTDATRTAGDLIELFHDPDGGGFFTSGSDAHDLLVRGKDLFDNATPSANSLAADGLLRLGALTGDPRWREPAVGAVCLVADHLAATPAGFGEMLEAQERIVLPSREIVLTGDRDNPDFERLRRVVLDRILPGSITALGAAGPSAGSPLYEGRATGGTPTAYVCEGYVCREPVTSVEELERVLDTLQASR